MSRLTDKAKNINFDDEQAPPPSPATLVDVAPDKPRTAIGRLSASFAVEAENRTLKERLAEFEDANVVEFLDPKTIRPSEYANRHEDSFAGVEFQRLKHEIASAGRNVQAIKVRRLKRNEERKAGAYEYEIVFGHRRHRACLDLGLKVACVIEDLTDPELFIEMDRENRQREDLSAWEQGVMYQRALDNKLFASQRQLSDRLGVSEGAVSMAVKLAALPVEVIQAFPSPLEIQFRWVKPLSDALERSSTHVTRVAGEILREEPRPRAGEVFARLTSKPDATGEGAPAEPLVFTRGGKRVGQLERDRNGNVSLKVKAGALSAMQQKRLAEFLSKLFD
jgi:ParB family transcriptional regulator, chromosome partitioning protein